MEELEHKAALLRLYQAHRPEFANAAKVQELWSKVGGLALWAALSTKYGAGVVAEYAEGLALPEEPAFAPLREAVAARRG